MSRNKSRIGISIGDPNGIGPEVMLKCFADERVTENFIPVIYAPAKVISFYRTALGLEKLRFQQVKSAGDAEAGCLNVVSCSQEQEEQLNIRPGVPDEQAAAVAVDAILRSAEDLEHGLLDGIVTNPINKYTANSKLFPYAGHTDFYASRFALLKGKALMILTGPECTVAPVTVHIPLKEVAASISVDLIIEKMMMLDLTLKRDFDIRKPAIGVMALNPHAGDNGLIGKEDLEVLQPAIVELFEQHKINAFGPFSPDAYWGSGTYKKFDATLCMYHDQGLIPFKLLCMDRGVNYTAGLRIVRCSPDHGTAFDIAGSGVADESSFREAVYLCLDICRNRKRFDEALKNPLRKTFYDKTKDTGLEDLPPVDEDDE